MTYYTWTCPHCDSIWSREVSTELACDSFLCHSTKEPYVVIFNHVLCVCCDGGECKTQTSKWSQKRIQLQPWLKIPRVDSNLTPKDQTKESAKGRAERKKRGISRAGD